MGRMIATIRQGLWALADVVFPPICAGCGAWGAALCPGCRAALAWVPAGQTLLDLGQLADGLDDFQAALWFQGPTQKALHRLKYRHDVGLAETLGGLVARRLDDLARRLGPAVVVPVPLSPERLRERGYNQAGLLARAVAERWGLACKPAALARIRSTHSQVGLSRRDRQQNVKGAFVAAPRLVGDRPILLVDDTCTTGATLHDCARALKAAGARRVSGLAIAQAPLRGGVGKDA